MKKVTLNPFLDIKECWWTIDEEPYKFEKGIWKEVDEDTWSEVLELHEYVATGDGRCVGKMIMDSQFDNGLGNDSNPV